MTLTEARLDIERRFLPYPQIGNYALSATGEPYVEICSGSAKQEGDCIPALCSSPELAIALWYDAVVRYAKERSGQLYWRVLPEIDGQEYVPVAVLSFEKPPAIAYARKRYAVYSRLLISDKPVRYPAFIERNAA